VPGTCTIVRARRDGVDAVAALEEARDGVPATAVLRRTGLALAAVVFWRPLLLP
jgi:hypothetical protein